MSITEEVFLIPVVNNVATLKLDYIYKNREIKSIELFGDFNTAVCDILIGNQLVHSCDIVKDANILPISENDVFPIDKIIYHTTEICMYIDDIPGLIWNTIVKTINVKIVYKEKKETDVTVHIVHSPYGSTKFVSTELAWGKNNTLRIINGMAGLKYGADFNLLKPSKYRGTREPYIDLKSKMEIIEAEIEKSKTVKPGKIIENDEIL